MRKIAFILILWSLTGPIHSQTIVTDEQEKNGVYVEAGGNAFVYSINYERRFFLHQTPRITMRVGFATFLADEPFIIPIECTYLFGKKRHFEAGFGRTFLQEDGFNIIRLGYRHESRNKKRIFRAAFTPLLGVISDDIISNYPWLGLSYGLRF